jgi:hypothetical protein
MKPFILDSIHNVVQHIYQCYLSGESYMPLCPSYRLLYFEPSLKSIFLQTSNQDQPSEKKGIVKNIQFLLCGSCFWCASQSNNCNTSDMITECPSCNATRVESLPISHDEVYRFGYDPNRGVTLEFSN